MKTILMDTWRHWKSHNTARMGAALSYYAMLSFIPLLLLVVTATSMLFKKDVVEITLMHQLITTVGSNASHYISELLHNTPLQHISMASALLSGLVFVVGTLGIFSELDRDLDELWHMTSKGPKKPLPLGKKITRFIREKIILLSLIPILAILLIIAIGVTTFLSVVQVRAGVLLSLDSIAPLLQILVPLVLGTALFAVVYRILPNRKLPWNVLLIGALVTSCLFVIGNVLIVAYIKLLVHTSVFGGASSLVGLLVWIYYSAQVFFLGASFTFVYANKNDAILSRDSSL